MTTATHCPTPTPPARRAPGDGALYLHHGAYMARLYLPGLRKYKKRSTGTTDLKKAERFLARWKAEIQGGSWAPDVDKTTFEQLATMLADDYQANGRRSWPRVQFAVAHLRATFGASRAARSRRTASWPTACGAKRRAPPTPLSTVNSRPSSGCSGSPRSPARCSVARTYRCWRSATRGQASSRNPTSTAGLSSCRKTFSPSLRSPTLPAGASPTSFSPASGSTWTSSTPGFGWSPGRRRTATAACSRCSQPCGPSSTASASARGLSSARRARSSRGSSTARGGRSRASGARGGPRVDGRPCLARSRTTSAGRRSGTWSAPGCPRSAAMKMVGHKTEAIYRRYAIAEEGMLREAGARLDRFHALIAEGNSPQPAPVVLLRTEAAR
jgi:hypothetical protein